jgi:transglutaminase-like putative cysteine protease
MMRSARIPAAAILVALACLLAGHAAIAATATAAVAPREPVRREAVVWERWYELSLDGRTVGWMRRWRERDAELVRTARQVHLRIERSGTPVVLETHSEFLESRDGVPVSASMRSRSAGSEAWSRWEFTDAGIRERTGEDGRVRERMRPPPAPGWLTPVAVDLLLAGRIEGAAQLIRWRELDPESGLAEASLELVAEGRDEVQVDERRVEATRWRMRGHAAGGLTHQWRSRDGRLLAETTRTPLGELRARLGEPARVRAAAEGASAEILVASVVDAVGELDARWRRIRFAVRLDPESAGGEDEAARIPDGGPQAVEAEVGDPGWWRVTVDPGGRVPGDRLPDAADLAATPLIDSEDPAVRELARSATGGGEVGDPRLTAAAAAEAMRRRVREHVREVDLGRLFDSASRAVRDRRGDCSEHAVLLAAMLRSRGIPARVAYGLVHAEDFAGRRDVFAWHMWTRAWIEDRWVDLDATRPRPFGPTHIRLGESAGDQAVLQELAATLLGTGRIEIRVLGGDP